MAEPGGFRRSGLGYLWGSRSILALWPRILGVGRSAGSTVHFQGKAKGRNPFRSLQRHEQRAAGIPEHGVDKSDPDTERRQPVRDHYDRRHAALSQYGSSAGPAVCAEVQLLTKKGK